MFNHYRRKYLEEYWHEEISEYKLDNEHDTKLLEKLGTINEKLALKILYSYLDRCKLINQLAFFQWRATNTDDEYEKIELRKVFDNRKEYLVRIMLKVDLKKKELKAKAAKAAKEAAEEKPEGYEKTAPAAICEKIEHSFCRRVEGIITTPFDMLLESIMRGKLDRENKITNLNSLGIPNPFLKKENMKEAKAVVKNIRFDEDVYPDNRT